MVRRQTHGGWVGNLGVRSRSNLALMAFDRIEDGKEGLSIGAIFPMRSVRCIVPDFGWFSQVVIGLAVVGTVVADLAQELRDHLCSGGHRYHRTHVQSAGTRWVHAGYDG